MSFLPFLLLFSFECFVLAIGDFHHFPFGQIAAGVPPPIRPKRQSFSRYICGIPPFIFHSDIPCSYWAICVNHGFATNLPCADTQDCLEHNPNTECVQGTCCTLPTVQMPSTVSTTSQFLPRSSSAASSSFSPSLNPSSLVQFVLPVLILLLFRLLMF
ncbi:hypothetical protein niasHT_038156 [Heterodera trifolii]|uniref:Uncharacterized protein n=1 Tax=Heterodera trifolii TaxID=157864 RepID=A0ABD2I6D6_9BILA